MVLFPMALITERYSKETELDVSVSGWSVHVRCHARCPGYDVSKAKSLWRDIVAGMLENAV